MYYDPCAVGERIQLLRKERELTQLERIFTLDKQRAQRFAGQASEEEMKQIEMAVKISLGMV